MIRPLADRIVIEPLDRKASSVIEVIHHEKPCLGRVVAIGTGKRDRKGRLQPLDAKPGDIVRYGGESYLTYPEYFDHKTLKTYLVIQEADIAGVVEH